MGQRSVEEPLRLTGAIPGGYGRNPESAAVRLDNQVAAAIARDDALGPKRGKGVADLIEESGAAALGAVNTFEK